MLKSYPSDYLENLQRQIETKYMYITGKTCTAACASCEGEVQVHVSNPNKTFCSEPEKCGLPRVTAHVEVSTRKEHFRPFAGLAKLETEIAKAIRETGE